MTDSTLPNSLTSTRFRVEGMDCASCARKIETAVSGLDGVRKVAVSASAGTMVIEHAGGNEVVVPSVQRIVTQLGYRASPIGKAAARDNNTAHADCDDDHHHDEGREHSNAHSRDHGHSAVTEGGDWWRSPKARQTILCGLALGVAWLLAHSVPSSAPWGFIAAMAVGLVPIAWRAVAAARAGMPFTIETLMTIAAIGAVAINAAEEAATVTFLFLVGEMLEGLAAGRARASINGLTKLVPRTALIERDGQVSEILAETLAVGNTILVRPGDRIPADGTIISGSSAIDEAPVTGESVPVRKSTGDRVYAGTIALDAAIRIEVTAAASDNTIARIVRLVEEAQERKAPTERFIDRFSAYYTPGVLVLGAAIATLPPLLFGVAWQEWIYKGLAVLLIGCPCALVISTPAAIAAGLANGARRGLLMKGGAVLEQMGSITRIAFDKTGTLTQGKPKVTDVIGVGRSERDVLMLASALETGSSHPLAVAILSRAREAAIEPATATELQAIAGKGISGIVSGARVFLGSPIAAAELASVTDEFRSVTETMHDAGKTVSVLIADRAIAGIMAMRDEPRADAQSAIVLLKRQGIAAIMLTGDQPKPAHAIASSLGIDVRAGLLPQDKQRIVTELKAAGERVAKVGDGINDAPALAAADIGIAMGGGTDVALETADAAVLHGRVMDVPAMVDLSRQTMSNIRQNLTIALGLKAVFLVTTLLGITGLWPAILADTGATVLVTLNALRLLSARLPGAISS